jgi:hypothetical protein
MNGRISISALHFRFKSPVAITEYRDCRTGPREDAPCSDVLSGQGILNPRHQRPCTTGNGRGSEGSSEGVFRIIDWSLRGGHDDNCGPWLLNCLGGGTVGL